MSGSDCTDLDHCECVDSLYRRIKLLEKRSIDSRIRIDDLESFVSAIASDSRQIPRFVRQCAMRLLTREIEPSEYSKVLYRIRLTDRGDYILESVVPTNFGGDGVNYVFRGRLEDCEIVRDQLVGLTSQIQNKTGNTIRGVGRA